MKKILSVTLVLLMLAGFGAVAAFADDDAAEVVFGVFEEAEDEDEEIEEKWKRINELLEEFEKLQETLEAVVNQIEARLSNMEPEKRAAIEKEFDDRYGAQYNRLKDEADAYKVLKPDTATAAYKAAMNLYFDFYQFQLTIFISPSIWNLIDGPLTMILQLIKFVLSFILRYVCFGWTGWMY